MDTLKQTRVLSYILATAQGLLQYAEQAEETDAVEELIFRLSDVMDACKDGIEETQDHQVNTERGSVAVWY